MSLGISNFLEEISSLSHSVLFLCFFALIAGEGFLISPCCSLELCIHCLCLSFSPLFFTSLLFTAICKASPDSHFAFSHFFSMGMVFYTLLWNCFSCWSHRHKTGLCAPISSLEKWCKCLIYGLRESRSFSMVCFFDFGDPRGSATHSPSCQSIGWGEEGRREGTITAERGKAKEKRKDISI